MFPLADFIFSARDKVVDAYRVILPLPVVSLPGVLRIEPSDLNSRLPVDVVISSVVNKSCVPAYSLTDVVGSSNPVNAAMLSWLASCTLTCVPVECTVTCPVKSLRLLNRSIFPVPPQISAVVALICEPVVCETPTPLRVIP